MRKNLVIGGNGQRPKSIGAVSNKEPNLKPFKKADQLTSRT